jgi:uncharacterized repeat protein (TIGR03806 family)
MKKLNLLAFLFLLIFSCQKDDENYLAQCEIPTNLSANNITFNNATLTWEDNTFTNGSNNSISFRVEYGLSGFLLGTGTTTSSNLTTLTVNGLLPNTTYDFYVQKICSSNDVGIFSEVSSFTTLALPVVPEFRQNLSELNLFSGNLGDLAPSPNTFEYELNTKLFTDYAHKQRLIAVPVGTTLTFNGDGLPNFPNNTVIAKTFFYNVDDRDLRLGKTIIETRVLIKQNGVWVTGDYKWNASQTEATLDPTGGPVSVSWIDINGANNNVNYQIPSNTDCFTCHQTNNNTTPIGPKLRSLNFEIDGVNQLQQLKDLNLLSGLSSPGSVGVLPNWEDPSVTLEQRARAYFDIQCAHCHTAGGYCEIQSTLRLSYETPFADSKILERKNSISTRINTFNPGFSMPLIGTTMTHTEGVALIQAYLDSL